MCVGLYTSRVVLKTLGFDDYGVYNVVGGFVSMLAYLNSAFVDATQRFMSFTLGTGDFRRLKTLFKTSLSIHYIIALIVLLIAETFGLWFVNSKLLIPPERLYAANWVYQSSVIAFLLLIVNIPYRACVVAHEHMNLFAYISVIEAILKLGIVFLLLAIPGDKLIIYSVLYIIISITVNLCYRIYCRRKFDECVFGFELDKPLFKEMFGYAGWVLVGNLGFSFKDQFSNILMNLFLGTAINAARGLATQVNGIITTFGNSFMTALAPQITKTYASNDVSRSKDLIIMGAKYSFLLMSLIIIPLCINIDYVLYLWLGEVPEYTSSFIIIVLIASTFYSASKTLTVGIQSTGNIKFFQIGISIIMLLELPFAYVLLTLGYPPYLALVPAIFTQIIGILFRLIILKKLVPTYEIRSYLRIIFLRCTPLMASCYLVCYWIKQLFSISLGGFIVSSTISISLTVVVIYILGLNKNERVFLNTTICNKLHIKKCYNESNNQCR